MMGSGAEIEFGSCFKSDCLSICGLIPNYFQGVQNHIDYLHYYSNLCYLTLLETFSCSAHSLKIPLT